jgi:hypothetical protein
MATLTKPTRVLGLTGCLGDLDIINIPSMINNNWFLSNMSGSGWKFGSFLFFFLFLLFFFFLFTGLLYSKLSLDEEDEMQDDLASEEEKEDLTGEEGEGST